MSNIPADLSYTAEHEWIAGPDADGAVRIGITDHAQGELGDVVFVQLPEVGESVEAGAAVGEIESTKSVSDIFAPVSGEVTAVNEALEAEPGTVNSAPYAEGWLFAVRPSGEDYRSGLLDAEGYAAQLD
ncbi:glycine cleavage system protein GcvH [Kocuria rosea]|jgi:glycine cleavage system H protein|uniref:glycine cleavage system protein GcvH n=1 Tax=Kocuria TaxID=57493 RepID=UPI00036D7B3A|nr:MULTISPECIES: glycine cleavage system protein GcvH [Kocuria]EYT50896.1 glycine cleavage system potein H [Kocuria sp. UCD-OTCP]MCM3487336.1 glycine cleavage system protein GcvH [Kocuria rosea]PWF79647.1 glycine cleavage system protein GcvH [Kocuria rosea]PWF85667.1 glycine cleavage system protein GcvH [Kocuria rosea]QCY33401.1 glycine cleavage system protein GcvH [Kocuria rosea]